MVRHDHVRRRADPDPARVDPARGEHVELADERRRIDDDAAADHRRDVGIQHARRDEVELEDLVAADDGVAGVVAALVADDHRDLLGEEVGGLALALVAPLEPHDHRSRHTRPPFRPRAAFRLRRSLTHARVRSLTCSPGALPSPAWRALQTTRPKKKPLPDWVGLGYNSPVSRRRFGAGADRRLGLASRDERRAFLEQRPTSWMRASPAGCRGRAEYSSAEVARARWLSWRRTRSRSRRRWPAGSGPWTRPSSGAGAAFRSAISSIVAASSPIIDATTGSGAGRVLCEQVAEEGDELGVELGAGVAAELDDRVLVAHRPLVRPVVGHRVIGVGDRHDPGTERDVASRAGRTGSRGPSSARGGGG